MSASTKKKYDRIQADIASGLSVEKAAKKNGVAYNTFYSWRRKLNGKATRERPALRVFDVPQHTAKAFIVFGAPDELAAFAKAYQ